MTERLTARTVRGLKWTYMAMAANMALQIALTAALARLLTPDSYGLVAMCYAVVRFGAYFAQLGIAPALIRHQAPTPRVIDTAFCAACGASVCLFVLTWLAAPAFAHVFGDSRIVPLVHIAAWSFLAASVSGVAHALLRRDMRFGAVTACEIASFLLGPVAVGLPLAVHGLGAESLVWGSLAQAVVLSVLTYSTCGHSFRPRFDPDAFRTLFAFGGRHSVIGFLEFVTYVLDVFLIAQILGAKALGLYNRATYLIQIPAQAINGAVTKVAYPALSAANSSDDRIGRAYLDIFMLLGMVLFPIGFGISAAAAELVAVILGPQWTDATPILHVLAIAVPFHLMLHVHGLAFDVKAALNLKLAIRLTHLCAMAVLYMTLARFGLIGFAVGFLIAEIAFYILYAVSTARMLAIDRREFAACHGDALVAAAATGLGIVAVSELLRQAGAAPELILPVQIATGAVLLGIQLMLFPTTRFSACLAMRLEAALPSGATATGRILTWYMHRLKRRALGGQPVGDMSG